MHKRNRLLVTTLLATAILAPSVGLSITPSWGDARNFQSSSS